MDRNQRLAQRAALRTCPWKRGGELRHPRLGSASNLVAPSEEEVMSEVLLDAAGRRRSPATPAGIPTWAAAKQ